MVISTIALLLFVGWKVFGGIGNANVPADSGRSEDSTPPQEPKRDSGVAEVTPVAPTTNAATADVPATGAGLGTEQAKADSAKQSVLEPAKRKGLQPEDLTAALESPALMDQLPWTNDGRSFPNHALLWVMMLDLSKEPSRAAIETLLIELKHDNGYRRSFAAAALGAFQVNEDEVVWALCNAIRANDPPKNVGYTIVALKSLSRQVELQIDTLIWVLESTKETLINTSHGVFVADFEQQAAITNLGLIGPAAARSTQAIRETITTSVSHWLHEEGMIALCRIENPDKTMELLIAGLQKGSTQRVYAEALSDLGRDAAPALPALIKVLDSASGGLRNAEPMRPAQGFSYELSIACIQAIAGIGHDAVEATPLLESLLVNRRLETHARKALASINAKD